MKSKIQIKIGCVKLIPWQVSLSLPGRDIRHPYWGVFFYCQKKCIKEWSKRKRLLCEGERNTRRFFFLHVIICTLVLFRIAKIMFVFMHVLFWHPTVPNWSNRFLVKSKMIEESKEGDIKLCKILHRRLEMFIRQWFYTFYAIVKIWWPVSSFVFFVFGRRHGLMIICWLSSILTILDFFHIVRY